MNSITKRTADTASPHPLTGPIRLTATPAAYRADFDRKIEEVRKANVEHLFCEGCDGIEHWYPNVWPAAIFTVSRDGISTDFVDDMMNYGTNGIPFGFFCGRADSFGNDAAFVALVETTFNETGGAMMNVDDAIALAIQRLTTYSSQSR